MTKLLGFFFVGLLKSSFMFLKLYILRYGTETIIVKGRLQDQGPMIAMVWEMRKKFPCQNLSLLISWEGGCRTPAPGVWVEEVPKPGFVLQDLVGWEAELESYALEHEYDPTNWTNKHYQWFLEFKFCFFIPTCNVGWIFPKRNFLLHGRMRIWCTVILHYSDNRDVQTNLPARRSQRPEGQLFYATEVQKTSYLAVSRLSLKRELSSKFWFIL